MSNVMPMAITATASSSICNLSSTPQVHSSISIPSNIFQRPSPPKPLSLNHSHDVHQQWIPSYLVSLLHFRGASVAAYSSTTQGLLSDWKSVGKQFQESKPGKTSRDSVEARKLFVGNLPYNLNSTQLAEMFEVAGTVESAEVICDRESLQSRGFAFVVMGSVEQAQEAIRKFDGSVVADRTLKVNFPEVPKGREGSVMKSKIMHDSLTFVDSPHKIYAGNLSWFVTSRGLRDAFKKQPGLLSARVIYDNNTGRSKGYGFVSFETAETAEAALNVMQGVELEGRALKLTPSLIKSPLASRENSDQTLEESDRLLACFSSWKHWRK